MNYKLSYLCGALLAGLLLVSCNRSVPVPEADPKGDDIFRLELSADLKPALRSLVEEQGISTTSDADLLRVYTELQDNKKMRFAWAKDKTDGKETLPVYVTFYNDGEGIGFGKKHSIFTAELTVNKNLRATGTLVFKGSPLALNTARDQGNLKVALVSAQQNGVNNGAWFHLKEGAKIDGGLDNKDGWPIWEIKTARFIDFKSSYYNIPLYSEVKVVPKDKNTMLQLGMHLAGSFINMAITTTYDNQELKAIDIGAIDEQTCFDVKFDQAPSKNVVLGGSSAPKGIVEYGKYATRLILKGKEPVDLTKAKNPKSFGIGDCLVTHIWFARPHETSEMHLDITYDTNNGMHISDFKTKALEWKEGYNYPLPVILNDKTMENPRLPIEYFSTRYSDVDLSGYAQDAGNSVVDKSTGIYYYNGAAIKEHKKKLCPEGYHVPTVREMQILADIDSSNSPGLQLKKDGFKNPNQQIIPFRVKGIEWQRDFLSKNISQEEKPRPKFKTAVLFKFHTNLGGSHKERLFARLYVREYNVYKEGELAVYETSYDGEFTVKDLEEIAKDGYMEERAKNGHHVAKRVFGYFGRYSKDKNFMWVGPYGDNNGPAKMILLPDPETSGLDKDAILWTGTDSESLAVKRQDKSNAIYYPIRCLRDDFNVEFKD